MSDNEGSKKAKWLQRTLFELSQNEGITQKEVAESLGINPTYLSAVSKGRRDLTDSLVYKLCKKYKLMPPGEDQAFREEQELYAQGNPAGVAAALKEHNESLRANLEDLRKNIEDLRRENEHISQYINDLKNGK